MMYFIVIILIVTTIIFVTRLFALKKEIKKLVEQLKNYNNRDTNKKIDMALIDKDIENLGVEINKLIDLHVLEKQKRVHFEDDHKRAIANISHDLRTPLTSIVGYIQMAKKEGTLDEERRELLSIAYERAKRLEKLLDEFYELSIIESTDHPLKFEQINLKNNTVEVLMSFYDRFHEKGIEPIIRMPNQDIFIIADISALKRVLENLISNAVTYTDGKIIISLEESKGTAKLMVQNETNKLTEEDVENLFDRFFMADQSRSSKNSGLGLSIAKSLMEKMNGTISGKIDNRIFSVTCEWKTVEG